MKYGILDKCRCKNSQQTLSQTESNGTFGCPERIDYDQMWLKCEKGRDLKAVKSRKH